MSGAKEIRSKIGSVKNTQKITRAMEMVAASKMRKAQDRMHSARPYADKVRNVIAHLAQAQPEYRHPYLEERDVKRVGIIIVSSDRGLCGGLNTNLFKTTLAAMREWDEKGLGIELCTVGSKALMYFRRLGGNIVGETTGLGDEPSLEHLVGTVKVMLDAYDEGRIDELHLVFNHFINTMTQRPQVERVIPIREEEIGESRDRWDYIYEPDAPSVLNQLMTRYIESLVYQAVMENLACEQAARMIAMKSASDNAEQIIDDLELAYNKARQAAITQEISEIVGGAAAV